MNTVIQNWDFLNDSSLALLPPPSTHCPSSSPPSEAAMLSNGVTELTWKNGQLAMQGLDTAKRVSSNKPFSSTTTGTTSVTDGSHNWAKPSCNGTLESVVDQAHGRATVVNDCVPWFMAQYAAIPPVVAAAATPTIRVDAMVPCSGSGQNLSSLMLGGTGGGGRCTAAASTRVESCSVGTLDNWNGRNEQAMKRAKLAAAADYSSRDNSVSGTMDTQQLTIDTCDWDADLQGAFTGNSLGSPGNTSSANKTAADDRDSVGQSRPQRGGGDEKEKKKVLGAKASISTKRSRAAAVHNQSERKRRDKINERMRTLQKLVPHSSKSDKASMLDEVIEYLKQLQVQINMMSRMGMSPMNMNPMMMPLALQQQMQMSMLSQMGMGMGINPMGMGMMDMNAMGRSNVPGLPPPVLHPNPFMPMPPPQWDITNAANANDRVLPPAPVPSLVPAPSGPPLVPDPIAASLLAFQPPTLTLEGYSKMAAMFQHMNQIPTSGPKN